MERDTAGDDAGPADRHGRRGSLDRRQALKVCGSVGLGVVGLAAAGTPAARASQGAAHG